MNTFAPRPYIEVIREAFRFLASDPGPKTPEKRDLMRELRQRIAEVENAQRPTSQSV
jgi:hypothetical protein